MYSSASSNEVKVGVHLPFGRRRIPINGSIFFFLAITYPWKANQFMSC